MIGSLITHPIVHYSHMLRIIGHRGAAGLAPENTLAAIRKALDHGCSEIEVDVRVSGDNSAVLHHDARLRDPAGNRPTISQHQLAELRGHKADLATLEEAISLIDRQVPLQIEVKPGEPVTPIIKLLRQFLADGWQAEDFLFGSRQQRALLEIHRQLPEIPLVVIEPYLSIRAHYRARQLSTKRLSMNRHGLWPGFIRAMSRRGYQLYAYTLDDPTKAERLHRHGLAGVITDRPDLYHKPS